MADEETLELEISEDDIVRYLHDDAGKEIGIVVLEDGQEVEYLYADDDEADGATEGQTKPEDEGVSAKAGAGKASSEAGNADGAAGDKATPHKSQAKKKASSAKDDDVEGVSYKNVQGATDDMNAIFKDGVKVANEFKGAYDDIKQALDWKSWLK